MTDIGFTELITTGHPQPHYVLHVLGMPWGISTTQAAADAVTGSQTARRKIFGDAHSTATYPADTVPVFPVLQLKSISANRWKLNEGKGTVDSSGWSFKVTDVDLGHDWDHAPSGDEIWGLEGLHRIAQPERSQVQGCAYLTGNCVDTATSISVRESSAAKLKDRVDAGETIIWINHEAILVDGYSSASGLEYDIDIEQTPCRGVYRSRPANHLTAVYADVNPMVADVPGSIAGRYVELWAIILDSSGGLLDEPQRVDEGVIAPGISTDYSRGLTTVRVNGPLEALKRKINTDRTVGKGRAARYVLSRNENAGTSAFSARKWRQCPHLVIREWNTTDYDWNFIQSIWLCGQGETVSFDTSAELIEALNTELQYCLTGSASQESGDGTTDNALVDTTFTYVVPASGGCMLQPDAPHETENGINIYKLSFVSGPLAFMLNLGYPDSDAAAELIQADLTSKRPTFDHVGGKFIANLDWDRKDLWLEVRKQNAVGVPAGPEDDVPEIAEWFIQYDWTNPPVEFQPSSDFYQGAANDFIPYPDQSLDHKIPDGKIWLNPQTDINNFATGDTITFDQMTGDIESTGSSGGYDYLELTGDKLTYVTPRTIGRTLFYIPRVELRRQLDGVEDEEERKEIIENFDTDEGDPLPISSLLSLDTTSVCDAAREILGEDMSLSVPVGSALSHIPFFTTAGDFTSMIDWDFIDAAMVKIRPSQTYKIPLDKKYSLFDLLSGEMMFHGLTMTHEWDPTVGQHMIRCREIGPLNVTYAHIEGRRITADERDQRARRKEIHSAEKLYNSIRVECNYFEDEYKLQFETQIPGTVGVAMGDSELHIQSLASHLPSEAAYIWSAETTDHFLWILRNLASLRPVQTTKTAMSTWLSIAVGREALITDAAARNPDTHARGLVDTPALVVEKKINIGRNECSYTYRLSGQTTYGWAPNCLVTSSSKVGNVITCTPDEHEFTLSTQPKDALWFDCWDVNPSAGTVVARDCSCGDYAVKAFEKNNTSPTVMEFTCSVTSAGVMTLTGADATSWDISKTYIVRYAKYDDCEACQHRYIFAADDNNTIGSGNIRARTWM